jgi:hypothetical protein
MMIILYCALSGPTEDNIIKTNISTEGFLTEEEKENIKNLYIQANYKANKGNTIIEHYLDDSNDYNLLIYHGDRAESDRYTYKERTKGLMSFLTEESRKKILCDKISSMQSGELINLENYVKNLVL